MPAPRPDHCLNCGKRPLDSAFCPDCGQENVSFAVPLPILLRDVGEEFAKWDGRLFRTLGLLLFKPGVLTREYAAGRRARYVSPFRLFFVATALFVALISLHPLPKMNTTDLADQVAKESRENAPPPPPPAPGTTARRGGEREKVGPVVFNKPIFPASLTVDGERIRQGRYLRAYTVWQKDPKNAERDGPRRQALIRQVLKMLDNPAAFLGELRQSIGKMTFFLLPVYALWVSLLFRGARRYYVEHLVFAVNQHTFLFLLGSVIDLAARRWEGAALSLILLYWVYEFIALRTVYRQGVGLTLFKQFVLNQLYGLALIIGFMIAVVVMLALL